MSLPQEKNDVETGETRNQKHLVILESPYVKLDFIRKVYSIIAIQLCLIITMGSVIIFVPSVKQFILMTKQTRPAIFIIVNISPLFALLLLVLCRKKNLFSILLVILLTLALAFGVGSMCALKHGKIVLLAAILAAVATVSIILYTIWADDFQFLGPFLLATSFMIITFLLLETFSPLGQGIRGIAALVFAFVFCAYVIYDTDNIIKSLSSDQYIWGSTRLHLDIVPIIVSILTCKRVGTCIDKP